MSAQRFGRLGLIEIGRVAGDVFALKAFTAQLLANTAGAGGAIEIMRPG